MTNGKSRISGKFGTPIIGIVGWKNSGKTTLTTRLIAEFVRRGLRVATVKHAHHAFQIDDDETDSARHRRAGANQVAVVSSKRMAVVTELEGRDEPDLAAVVAILDPCDLIVVEGYKAAPIFKIEARREATMTKTGLAADDPYVIAIAADHAVTDARDLPVFVLDDIEPMADLISARLLSLKPTR